MDENIEDYGPFIDEVMSLINDGTSRNEIETELRKGVDYYRIPINDSMRMVVRNHGGSARTIIGDLPITALIDVNDPDSQYNVKATILSVTIEQRGTDKKGMPRIVTAGTMMDDSDSKDFVIWGKKELDKDKVYIFKKCRFDARYNNLSISSGEDVTDTDAKIEISNDIRNKAAGIVRINSLDPSNNGKTICAEVISVREYVSRKGTPYKLLNLGDESGMATFFDWENRDYNIGDKLKITKIGVRESQGKIYLDIGRYSTIEKVI